MVTSALGFFDPGGTKWTYGTGSSTALSYSLMTDPKKGVQACIFLAPAGEGARRVNTTHEKQWLLLQAKEGGRASKKKEHRGGRRDMRALVAFKDSGVLSWSVFFFVCFLVGISLSSDRELSSTRRGLAVHF